MSKEELFMQNQGLIFFMIKRMNMKKTDELMQVGRIGLMKAAEKYKRDHGAKFTTFACTVIKNELLKYNSGKNKELKAISLNTLAHDDDCTIEKIEQLESGFDIEDVLIELYVQEFIASLDDKNKKIVVRRLQGDSMRDIAIEMGVSCEAISKRLRKMRKEWEEYVD